MTLDDDAGFALDDAPHLEADRSLRALLEVAHGAGSDGLVQREAVHGLANLVQFDAQGVGHQPDLPAPHHGGDGGGEHGRLVVHRLAHADQVPDGVGRLGGVVEDLLAAITSMVPASLLIMRGRTSPQPGPTPETNSEPPPSATASRTACRIRAGRCAGRRGRRAGVTTTAPRGGAEDVGEGVAGRTSLDAVHHGLRPGGEDGVDVGGGGDAEVAAEPGEVACVAPGLAGVGDDHAGEFQSGLASTARTASRPTLPVPQTIAETMRGM